MSRAYALRGYGLLFHAFVNIHTNVITDVLRAKQKCGIHFHGNVEYFNVSRIISNFIFKKEYHLISSLNPSSCREIDCNDCVNIANEACVQISIDSRRESEMSKRKGTSERWQVFIFAADDDWSSVEKKKKGEEEEEEETGRHLSFSSHYSVVWLV